MQRLGDAAVHSPGFADDEVVYDLFEFCESVLEQIELPAEHEAIPDLAHASRTFPQTVSIAHATYCDARLSS